MTTIKQNVVKLLSRKNRKPLTARQITTKLAGTKYSTVSSLLVKMSDSGLVSRSYNEETGTYVYTRRSSQY